MLTWLTVAAIRPRPLSRLTSSSSPIRNMKKISPICDRASISGSTLFGNR